MIPYKQLGVVLAIIISLTSLYTWVDGRGYARAISEITKESADKVAEATSAAIKHAEIEINKAQKRNRIIFDAELMSAREVQVVEIQIKEVINEVEKIKYVNNCGKLNVDSIRLLNEAIDQVNSASTN